MLIFAVIAGAFFAVALGLPLFAVIGVATIASFSLFLELPIDRFGPLVAQTMYSIVNKEALLAIPFFVLAGIIMTGGGISRRLIDFARSLVCWFPGGLAVAAIFACMIFAAISGSSPATVVAIGMVMYPALVRERYPREFGLGLLTASGSLGILIPPSIPMIIYSIMVPNVSVGNMFMAGIVPGLLLGGLMMIYSIAAGIRYKVPVSPFRLGEVWKTFRAGFWGISLPVIILGGIYSGLTTVNEAAALSVVYALFVELIIHRELKFREVPQLIVRAMTEMGAILIIVALAAALSKFLTLQRVPMLLTDLLQDHVSSKIGFLLLMNLLLLLTGCLMDIISAILILAPILSPVAMSYGIDPTHLGIIFIVNLEIGYLTPPLGMNLFVASSIFGESFTKVVKGALPFVVLLLVGLLLVTYIPQISLAILQ